MGYNTLADTLLGKTRRGSAGMTVEFQNADVVKRIFADLENELEVYAYSKDGTPLARSKPNAELREASKKIAEKVVIPQLLRAARSSPMRQAKAVASTAKPKSDRLVMVNIGQAIPPLPGFRKYRRTKKKDQGEHRDNVRWKTSVAWGSELGPHPKSKVNHYGHPRKESGYWVQPGVTNAVPAAVREYSDALNTLIARYSRYR